MASEFEKKRELFFDDALKAGYDLPKIRRVVEHKMRELAQHKPEEFKKVAYAVLKMEGMTLGKGFNNEKHL